MQKYKIIWKTKPFCHEKSKVEPIMLQNFAVFFLKKRAKKLEWPTHRTKPLDRKKNG